MTPINPATPGGLPAYAPTAAPQQQVVDPSQPGFSDPYATAYESAPVDAYAGMAPDAAYGSAVAGMQPLTTEALPDATLDDFAKLGIFTDEELGQLAQMNLPPQELNAIFDEAVAFMQTPEFAQLQAEAQGQVQGQGQGQAPVDAQPQVEAPAPAAAGATGEPAWNEEWEQKFGAMLDEQGVDSKTRMMVMASLRQAPLGEAELAQALEYYSNSPEGKAELAAADEQVLAGGAQETRMLLTMGLGAAGIAGVAGAVGASRGNLVKALERTVAGADPGRAAVAARALDDIKAGRPLTTAMRSDIVSTLRGEAGATSRLRHPLAKMSLNGGARHLTPATKLPFKEAMKYGLWMKTGDYTADAAQGAATATRGATEAAKAGGAAKAGAAAKVVAGGGDDAVRAVAGSADEVGKVAGGAAQAAKGAGMLGKVGRALGPVGLALSAGVGIWGISKTVEAEGGFGKESAKMTGNVAGGIAGGVAGAAAGAAIGSVVPVIGTGIGAVVGGIAGSIGLSKIGEGIGGFVHGLFD